MRIQIASDIHLECLDDYNIENFIVKSDEEDIILILCGDICSLYLHDKLYKFLQDVCSMFKHVIYVPGNNEFYKIKDINPKTYTDLCKQLDSYSNSLTNLHILNMSCIEIGEYLFSGCILWTQLEVELPKYFRVSGFNTEIYNRKNKQDTIFIKECIDYANTNKLKHIVITHYPPSKKCLDRISGNDKYESLYYNELDYLFSNKLLWVYGHTHYNVDINIDNTRLVSNQYGKKNNITNNFSNNFIINI